MGKRKRSRLDNIYSPLDRLGALPENVILYILSFLETKEVIQTSILARSWRYRWIGVCSMKIDDSPIQGWNKLFTVTKTTKGTVFMKFISWVRKVMRRKSLKLEADMVSIKKPFSLVEDICMRYIQVIYSTAFKARFTRFLTSFPLLKKLSIESCEGLKRINIEVPTLEFLAIEVCDVLDRVQIITPQLKNLKIGYWRGDILVIDAPNLEVFEWLNSYASTATIRIMNGFHFVIHGRCLPFVMRTDRYFDFLKKVSHAHSLELDNVFIQYFTMLPMYRQLKHLKLSVIISIAVIKKIVFLLRSCPMLQKLTFNTLPTTQNIINEEVPDRWEEIPCLSNHVSHVEFETFMGRGNEYALIRLLVGQCRMLETLLLNISESGLPRKAPIWILHDIRRMPRASRKLNIAFA